GDYIEQPVKIYSSGMALRLAFAVQVHVDPDILIVDEALAVGDAAFQAKALARVDEILARGTTLLFVGHDLNGVRAFCHRAMLLEKGRIVDSGLPDDVVVAYMQRNQSRILEAQGKSDNFAIKRLADGYGVEDACVVACTLNGQRHLGLRHGERVELEFQVRLRPDLANPGLTIDIVDAKGLQISGRRIALPRVQAVATVGVSVSFDATLQQGLYRLRLRVVDAPRLDQTTILSRQDGHLSFEILDDCRDRFTGLFPLPMDIQVSA
ncbi:MAG: Wzt carbohydrate-binding domain-containing protein, partial [Thermomonas sp.]